MKFFRKENILFIRLFASILALLSIITIFFTQLTWELGDPSIHSELYRFSFVDVAFGKITYDGIITHIYYYGNKTVLWGYILLGLGALLGLFQSFKEEKGNKTVKMMCDILTNLLLIGGGILLLLQRDAFINSNIGYVDNTVQLAASPIVGAVASFTASVGITMGIIIDK